MSSAAVSALRHFLHFEPLLIPIVPSFASPLSTAERLQKKFAVTPAGLRLFKGQYIDLGLAGCCYRTAGPPINNTVPPCYR